MTFDSFHPVIEKVIGNVEKVMIGKRKVAELSVIALIAKGHILLEDVPGVGKTMMVKSLAKSVGAEFKRIQFTPDLLPSDVIGSSIYNPKELKFEYRPGPLMANIVLADEINRTSPKTQAALLEGMEEGNVTIDGVTKPLPDPFFVMATQNPIDYEGTYPLPEAQLDRFLLKITVGYPSPEEEIEVLTRSEGISPIHEISDVISLHELKDIQQQASNVFVEEYVKEYIVEIVNQTRNHPSIYIGASPRGSISLLRAVKACAFMKGRDYVVPDDVKFLAPYVLGHRLLLKSESKFTGVTPEEIILDILENVNPNKIKVRK